MQKSIEIYRKKWYNVNRWTFEQFSSSYLLPIKEQTMPKPQTFKTSMKNIAVTGICLAAAVSACLMLKFLTDCLNTNHFASQCVAFSGAREKFPA